MEKPPQKLLGGEVVPLLVPLAPNGHPLTVEADDAPELFDRVRAMTWRLLNPRR